MSELVTIDIKNHIAHIKLNRPEKYNALSAEMFKAIVEAGEQVAADASIRPMPLRRENSYWTTPGMGVQQTGWN